jgi:hypothetical protein
MNGVLDAHEVADACFRRAKDSRALAGTFGSSREIK